jgi:hypothetical protein
MKPHAPFAARPSDVVGFSIFRETFLCTLDEYGAKVCREFGEVLGERFLERAFNAETPSVPVSLKQRWL